MKKKIFIVSAVFDEHGYTRFVGAYETKKAAKAAIDTCGVDPRDGFTITEIEVGKVPASFDELP